MTRVRDRPRHYCTFVTVATYTLLPVLIRLGVVQRADGFPLLVVVLFDKARCSSRSIHDRGNGFNRKSFSASTTWLSLSLLLDGGPKDSFHGNQRPAVEVLQTKKGLELLEEENKPKTSRSLANDLISPSSFSSNKERARYIRGLVWQGRYSEIETFLDRWRTPPDTPNPAATSPHSSFVYTAAMSAMAKHQESKHGVWPLFQKMEAEGITPTSFTFSALFQSIQQHKDEEGIPAKILNLRSHLVNRYPHVRWTPHVFQHAILACARCDITFRAQAWSVVQQIPLWMELENVAPTYRIYLAMIHVCASIQHVDGALQLKKEMIQDKSIRMDARIWGSLILVYANKGDYQGTRALLKQMHQEFELIPNVRHCTLHLKALATAGRLEDAVKFLDFMAGLQAGEEVDSLCVPVPDHVAVLTLLSSCASVENYELAYRILEGVKHGLYGEVKINEQMYNLALRACRDPVAAKNLIREMRLTRKQRVGVVPPSLLSYTRAVVVCRKAGDLETALALLERTKHDAIKPDTFLFSAVIWTAAAVGDCDTAYEIMERMKTQGCKPTIVTFNGLISALASAGRAQEAIDVFEELIESGLEGTRFTFVELSRVLTGVIQLDERVTGLERVFKLLNRSARSVSISGPITGALISAHGASGRYPEARSVFDSIEGPADTAALRAILFACGNTFPPKWEDALSLLRAAGPASADPIAVSNTMVACSKADKWEESLQLLRRYGSNKTSVVAFNSLIGACGRSGRSDMAMEILNEMDDFGVHPDPRSYRQAIIACNQAQHAQARRSSGQFWLIFEWWECALSLLRRMHESGLQPDIQAYSSVISSCEAAGKWQRALTILQSLMDGKTGLEPNVYCFNAAISACEKGGAWVEALELYEQMKNHRNKEVRPNEITIGSVILALEKAGQKELSQSIFAEGMRRKVLNPWRTTVGSNGQRIRAMDLHHFSAALARTAIRYHMESLLENCEMGAPAAESGLVIIVGKGLRSTQEPILLGAVKEMLVSDYGIEATVDPKNPGRLLVNRDELDEFVSRRSWRH